MENEQLSDLATRLEKRAHDIRADGTRHCGPVSEKEAAIREADALLEEAGKIRMMAERQGSPQGIEARSAETQGGSAEGKSPVVEDDAPSREAAIKSKSTEESEV